ncbi:hypothetical protein AAE478_002556 [Parahypoxylon ruwenzoriense]
MATQYSSQRLSPTDNHRNEENSRPYDVDENGQVGIVYDEGDGAGERDRLFAFEHGDAEEAAAGGPASRRRQPWWLIAIFPLFCVGTIVTLAWLALSLDILGRPARSPLLEAALSAPLRRPDEDYILDPNWDFGAPNQVRAYDWAIVDKEGEPDGVRKPMLTIDGRFPGPLIEINEGDVVEVNVRNLAANATAIHWHGIFQNGTNWMDGAAGVTQCPIAPGASYRYRFNVTGQAGTYFYHAHQGVQALSGLVGPLVVHSRDEAAHQPVPYSSDRVILLQDWYYDADSGLMRDVLSPGVEDAPIPNTALMNGVNQANCSNHPNRPCSDADGAPFPTLDLAPGQGHRLRFLNVGGFAWFQVAADEHDSLPIIEVDGTPVEPASEPELVIAPGQRYSVVLTASHPAGKDAFWLRARMITSCFASQKLPENGIDEAKAVIRYRAPAERHDDEERESLPLPTTTSKLPYLPICRDMVSTSSFSPSPALPVPPHADHSWYLRVNLEIGDWRLQRGVVNGSSFRPCLGSPTLHRVLDGLKSQDSAPFAYEGVLDNAASLGLDTATELVISHSSAGVETVDIVLQNMDENSHPFHLHGAQFWVLGTGHGYFPGYAALFPPPPPALRSSPQPATTLYNPPRRDTVGVEGFGWAVLRFVADNPGVWLFHCHALWHSEAGMGMQFLARADVVRGWEIPEDARALCAVDEGELRKGAAPGDEEFSGFGGVED